MSALWMLWQKNGDLIPTKAVGTWCLGMGGRASPVASGTTEPTISSFNEKSYKEKKAEVKKLSPKRKAVQMCTD